MTCPSLVKTQLFRTKSGENPRKTQGKPEENQRKTRGKPEENPGKTQVCVNSKAN
jgi:hypothetical protein